MRHASRWSSAGLPCARQRRRLPGRAARRRVTDRASTRSFRRTAESDFEVYMESPHGARGFRRSWLQSGGDGGRPWRTACAPERRDALEHPNTMVRSDGSTNRSSIHPPTCALGISRTCQPLRARSSIGRPAQPDGSLLREYELYAVDRELEIAPGVYFPAWTYHGQVPGPTIRATEGDRVLVSFINQGSHPHSIHSHSWHPPAMDGALPPPWASPPAITVVISP